MTGHAIPTGMSYSEAERQLRKQAIQAWQSEGLAEVIEEVEADGWGESARKTSMASESVRKASMASLPSAPLPVAPPPVAPSSVPPALSTLDRGAPSLDDLIFDALSLKDPILDDSVRLRLTEYDGDTGDEMEEPGTVPVRLPRGRRGTRRTPLAVADHPSLTSLLRSATLSMCFVAQKTRSECRQARTSSIFSRRMVSRLTRPRCTRVG